MKVFKVFIICLFTILYFYPSKSLANSCATATPITLPFYDSGSTIGMGDDNMGTGGCSGVFLGEEDVFYSYTSLGNEYIKVHLEIFSQSNFYCPAVYLFSDCPSVANSCLSYKGTCDPILPEIIGYDTYYLEEPGQYYIVVSSSNNAIDFYNLEITEPIDGAVYENPLEIGTLPYSYTGTTIGYGDDYDNTNFCTSDLWLYGNDIVFRYLTGEKEVVKISLTDFIGSNHNAGFYVLDGHPDNAYTNCLAEKRTTSASIISENSLLLPSNTNIYIIISTALNKQTLENFTLTIEEADEGTRCENAIVIDDFPFIYQASTVGKGIDYGSGDINGCNATYYQENDIVFSYESKGNENLDFEISDFTESNHYGILLVLDNCPDDPNSNCLGSNYGISNSSLKLTDLQLDEPGTYYIVVSSFFNNSSIDGFKFSVKDNGNTDCGGPFGVLTGWLQTDATFYDCKNTHQNFELYYNIGNVDPDKVSDRHIESFELYRDNWATDLEILSGDPLGVYTKNGRVRAVLQIPELTLTAPGYSTRELIQYNRDCPGTELVYHEMFHQFQWAYIDPTTDRYFNNIGFFENMAKFAQKRHGANESLYTNTQQIDELSNTIMKPWDAIGPFYGRSYQGALFFQWLMNNVYYQHTPATPYGNGLEAHFEMYDDLLMAFKTVSDDWTDIPYIPLLTNDFAGVDIHAIEYALRDENVFTSDEYIHRFRAWTLHTSIKSIQDETKSELGFTFDLINNSNASKSADIDNGHARIWKIAHQPNQRIKVEYNNQSFFGNDGTVLVSIISNENKTNSNNLEVHRMLDDDSFEFDLEDLGPINSNYSFVVVSPATTSGNINNIQIKIETISSPSNSVAAAPPNTIQYGNSIAANNEAADLKLDCNQLSAAYNNLRFELNSIAIENMGIEQEQNAEIGFYLLSNLNSGDSLQYFIGNWEIGSMQAEQSLVIDDLVFPAYSVTPSDYFLVAEAIGADYENEIDPSNNTCISTTSFTISDTFGHTINGINFQQESDGSGSNGTFNANTASCLSAENELEIQINLDAYPMETSWELLQADGTVLLQTGNLDSTYQLKTYIDKVCLIDDCYFLNVYDNVGNGICCSNYGNGSIKLFLNGNLIQAHSGNFAAKKVFTIDVACGTAELAVGSKSLIQQGNDLILNFDVENNGLNNSGNFNIAYLVCDENGENCNTIGTSAYNDNIGITASSSSNLTLNLSLDSLYTIYPLEEGLYTIACILDADNTVVETDETNNKFNFIKKVYYSQEDVFITYLGEMTRPIGYELGTNILIEWADNIDASLLNYGSGTNGALNFPITIIDALSNTPALSFTIPYSAYLNRSYLWTIPTSFNPSIYRIRIAGNASINGTNFGLNSPNFPIGLKTVSINNLIPNVVNGYQDGQTVFINYQSNLEANDISLANKLRLRLIDSNGNSTFVSDLVDPNGFQYAYALPTNLSEGYYRFKLFYTESGITPIVYTSANGPVYLQDFSDYFYVGNSNIPSIDPHFSHCAQSSASGDSILINWNDNINADIQFSLYFNGNLVSGSEQMYTNMPNQDFNSFYYHLPTSLNGNVYKIKLEFKLGSQVIAEAFTCNFCVDACALNILSDNSVGNEYYEIIDYSELYSYYILEGDFSASTIRIKDVDGNVLSVYNNALSRIIINTADFTESDLILDIKHLTNFNLNTKTWIKNY